MPLLAVAMLSADGFVLVGTGMLMRTAHPEVVE